VTPGENPAALVSGSRFPNAAMTALGHDRVGEMEDVMARWIPTRSRLLLVAALVLSTALVAACTVAPEGPEEAAAEPTPRADTPVANLTPGDGVAAQTVTALVGLPDLVDRVIGSVVLIEHVGGAGSGSGIVLDREGHILTNYHVVDQMGRIKVTLYDGSASFAVMIGSDPSNDLAVIRADGFAGDQLHPASLGDSSRVRVGQPVFAIGNPFSERFTVTQGIISAINRSSTSFGGRAIQGVLQTDAALNPGNSGGPLFNLDGEVIGVNTSIRNPQGQTFAGLGFAVPSNTATRYLSQMVAGETIQHPQLGVGGPVRLDEVTAAELGVEQTRGLYITTIIPNGAAARAGMQPGDIIVELNGQRTHSFEELARAIESASVGDEVELVFIRGGVEQRLTVTLLPWSVS
jgi:S1-C subfamily serine protease